MPRLALKICLAGVLIFALAACSLPGVHGITRHSAPPVMRAPWQIVPTPALEGLPLHALAVESANDIWAVSDNTTSDYEITPILHWNGVTWQAVPLTHDTSSETIGLFGVAALSPTDAWVVGGAGVSQGASATAEPVIAHWDGSSWQIVPSPNVEGELVAISATSASDIWAVGITLSFTELIEHWDGSEWRVIPDHSARLSDCPHCAYELQAVTDLSAQDVWTVGFALSQDAPYSMRQVIEHWNGSEWQMAPSPATASNPALFSIAANTASDIWAVGAAVTTHGNVTLTEHWDGAAWRVVPSPNRLAGDSPDQGDALFGVAARSRDDVWAVGSSHTGDEFHGAGIVAETDPINAGTTHSQTLIEHWDGKQWSIVPSDDNTNLDLVRSVAFDAQGSVWAAGRSYSVLGDFGQPLIEEAGVAQG